jgi:hypothetical protein
MHILKTIGRRVAPIGVALGVTAAVVLAPSTPAWAVDSGTMSTATGPSGGGNWIRITGASGTPFATIADMEVQFVSEALGASCAAFGGKLTAAPIAVSGNTQSAGVLVVTDGSSGTSGDLALGAGVGAYIDVLVPQALQLAGTQTLADYNVCVYDTSALIANIDTTGYTIYPKLTVPATSLSGPSGGGNTLTLTANVANTFNADTTYGVQFQVSASPNRSWCAPSWGANTATPTTIVPAAPDGVLSGTKLVVTVPTTLLVANGNNWHVCVYESVGATAADATNDLIAGTGPAAPVAANAFGNTYSIANKATITSVTPSSGPAMSTSTITVVGTNFPADLTATIAGEALTIVGTPTSTQFTALVPPRAAGGPFNLVVNTSGGPTTRVGAFTYSNGIVVTPNTASPTRFQRTYLDVKGIGFGDLTVFPGASSQTRGTSPNSAGAHVYLANGRYNPAPAAVGSTAKTNGQIAECLDVIVIDDTELVCSLYLGGQASPVARTTTGCTVAATTLTALVFAGSCALTTADVGSAVTGTGITAGTIVTAVTATGATLSKAATGAITNAIALTLTPRRALGDVTFGTAGGFVTLASTVTPFVAGDVGRAVLGTGLPTGAQSATITAVNAGVATLSAATCLNGGACPGGTSNVVDVIPVAAVPVGTYTVTVVSSGAANAQSVAGYSQSIISSGSTFTVAEY